MTDWPQRFPDLFAPVDVDYADADAQFTLERPPDELVSRYHVVARTDGGVVVCVNDLGWRFLPGGTREPGESLEGTVDRELREEAGARRTSGLTYLGAHRSDSRRTEPYRPHIPHPRAYWAYAVTDVVVDSYPTNPPDGEQVIDVLVLPARAAAAFIGEHDPMHPGVVRLADAMGLV